MSSPIGAIIILPSTLKYRHFTQVPVLTFTETVLNSTVTYKYDILRIETEQAFEKATTIFTTLRSKEISSKSHGLEIYDAIYGRI